MSRQSFIMKTETPIENDVNINLYIKKEIPNLIMFPPEIWKFIDPLDNSVYILGTG